ncbi:hypothetical protein HC891_08115 [Candidatus Gracilibacteria bacterium]|nr:hypothetical protein [Candidatus Gracilibacteria bacterium]
MAQVHLDAPGSGFIAKGEKSGAGLYTTGNSLIVTPEHSQCHQLADLGAGGGMRLFDLLKASGCLVEGLDRLLHLALGESGDTGGPGGDRVNFRLIEMGGKRSQRMGRRDRLGRFVIPSFVATIF